MPLHLRGEGEGIASLLNLSREHAIREREKKRVEEEEEVARKKEKEAKANTAESEEKTYFPSTWNNDYG